MEYSGTARARFRRIVPARAKSFLKHLLRETIDDRLASGAAALAFYLVLSLFPAAIFGLSVLPYLPIPHLQEALMDIVRQALPSSSAQLLTSTVESVVADRSGGLLSFGFVFAIWSASNGLYAVMQQLNVVYNVRERRPFWRARGIALLLTLAFFVLVVGALGLVVFGGMAQDWLAARLGWNDALLAFFAALRWVIIVAALALAFSIVYHLGPNVDLRFSLFSPGSLVATAGVLLV